MLFIQDNLLTLITFSPLLGALILVLLPRGNRGLVRWLALLFSVVPLLLSIQLWVLFNTNPCTDLTVQPCFEQRLSWFPLLNSDYHVGIDGISLTMILLTTLLVPLAVLMSWRIEDRVRLYMALFLVLETGMLGVFVSLDLLIFFVFWEFGLVPMYFLINLWGGENRQQASSKFFMYTMAGSLGLLLSIQLIGLLMGTFDISELIARWPQYAGDGGGRILSVSASGVKTILFWLFTLAFAVKVPVWPFHTWLPDAHTEAPTAGSMILAGVLLKLGASGFLRLVLPLFPGPARTFAPVLAVLATLAIVLGALAAFGQRDVKRLVAYSSVNHMGFVMLGVAAAAWVGVGGQYAPGRQLDGIIALNGAVLQMFNHGVTAAAMFALVGVMYGRLRTRDLTRMGGLWVSAPVFGGLMIFTSMASLGLPGLNGFVSEFPVLRGVWPVSPFFRLLVTTSLLGVLITGAYVLKAVRNTLHGSLSPASDRSDGHSLDINLRETVAVMPLVLLMLVTGLFPAWIADVVNATVTALLS